jgi:TolA-binding protein
MKKQLMAFFVVLFSYQFVYAQEGDLLDEKSAQKVESVKPKDDVNAQKAIDDEQLQSFIAEKEVKLSELRQRNIANMRGILAKNSQYGKKADLLFRIAEAEWDEAKYRYFLKRKEYDKVYEAYLNGTVKVRPEEPVADYSKAIDLYKDLLKDFPNYEKVDQIMFYLGQGLKLAGDAKGGASYMSRLTRSFPNSKFATRAYLAVAEYYFDKDLLLPAKENYLKVLADKQAPEYPYSVYKIGYVYYNLKEYDDSIRSFQEVIEMALSGQKKITFKDQAFSALALAYAEIPNGWQTARDYFIAKGGDDLAIEQLEKIARVFDTQDKIDLEMEVYKYLIESKPTGKKIPEYADAMVEAYKKGDQVDKIEEKINFFLDYFDPKASWAVTNQGDESAMTRANQFRETRLDYLIGVFHTKAQDVEKEKGEAMATPFYDKAAKYYDLYLASFSNKPDAYEKEYFLAEIMSYQKGNWDEAIRRYSSVVKRDPKGKHSKDAAFKVILSAEEKMGMAGLIEPPAHFRDEKTIDKQKVKEANVEYTKDKGDKEFKPVQETPMQPTELAFLEACKGYTDTYPEDADVPAVAFRAAELFINKGHYQEGIGRLEVIMQYHTNHKFASFAAAKLFDANYRLRRWDQMEKWGRYMLDKKNYQVLTKQQLQDVIAISINEYSAELSANGTKLKEEGKVAEGQALQDKAVEQMLRFLEEFPKHEKAAIALFNAAALTEKAEKTEKAVALYEKLIGTYPKSVQATEAHFVLGALYESQTKFEEAAVYFEKMANFPDTNQVDMVQDSLYNAGAIRNALQQYDKAITIFEIYLKKYPQSELSPDLYFEIATAFEKQKRWADARKVYDRYIKQFQKTKPATLVKAHLLTAENHQKENTPNARKLASTSLAAAIKVYGGLKADEKQDSKIKFYASRARFLEAEYLFKDFDEFKLIPYPQNQLVRTLTKKAELQQAAEKVYLEVLDYKVYQVSAGAFYRIAHLYNLFAKTLVGLEAPKEIQDQPELMDVYQVFIEEKVLPLEEKAVESANGALKLAHENKIYNEWSAQSAGLLAQLNSQSYPVINDAVVNTEWDVPATFSTTYIEDPEGKLEMMVKPAAPVQVPAPTPAPATQNNASPATQGTNQPAPATQPASDASKGGK